MNSSTKLMFAGAGAVGAATLLGMYARGSSESFNGKSVLITGGARGLGFLMAKLLAGEGAQLTLVSRNGDQLAVAERRLKQSGARVTTLVCDVRDRKQIQDAIDESVKVYGAIDLLINNAGVIHVGPFEDVRIEDFEDAMATHAWAPLYGMLAALPHMRKQGGGRIVNISSVGGK